MAAYIWCPLKQKSENLLLSQPDFRFSLRPMHLRFRRRRLLSREIPRDLGGTSLLSRAAMPEKLVSLLGVFVLLGCAWGLSLDRKRFPVRVVVWGFALQVAFAVVILKTTFGVEFFEFAQKSV